MGNYELKGVFAYELIYMGDVEIPSDDYEKLDLRDLGSAIQFKPRKASYYLKKNGWKWQKL